jgi:hypothetical protein
MRQIGTTGKSGVAEKCRVKAFVVQAKAKQLLRTAR